MNNQLIKNIESLIKSFNSIKYAIEVNQELNTMNNPFNRKEINSMLASADHHTTEAKRDLYKALNLTNLSNWSNYNEKNI